MLKKNLAVGITLLFIFSATIPTISGFDYWVQDENQILNLSECKDITRSYDAHIFCIGRIDNLSVNGTSYAFDCVNVRMISRTYYDGLPTYFYIRLKKSNVFHLLVYRKLWEFTYTHYYDRDFYRFYLNNCTFSGILKPSYIIGVFYLSMGNNSIFCDSELIENNKIKCEDESLNLRDSSSHIRFFIGTISDLEVGEDYYSFNATNLFRTEYYKSSNFFWRFRVQRIRNMNYSFYYGGFQFRGILTSGFICGFFYH